MATEYISKVKLPGSDTIYQVKDSYAWEQIDKLSNATHFLGVTDDAIEDGASTPTSITIGSTVYAVSPTTGQKQLNNGDIVVSTGVEDSIYTGDKDGTEFIAMIPGLDSAAITWFKFGSAKLNDLGYLAYKNSATGSITPKGGLTGSISVNNKTLSASAIPLTLSTTAVTGATSFKAVNTPTSGKANVTVSYSKATGGTASVGGSATLTGTTDVSVATALTAGTVGSSKYVVNVPANTYVTAIPSTATATGGAVTVGSATVYGLASATTKYMTGPESLNPQTVTVLSNVSSTTTASFMLGSASVESELLTFSAANAITGITFNTAGVLSSTTTITAGTSATASTYTVGKSGSANITTEPTIAIANPTKNSAATLSLGTSTAGIALVNSVTLPTATFSIVDVTVSGDIEAAGTVTITNTAANATGSTDGNVITGLTTSTFYGTVSAYAGGDHNHTLSNTLAFSGSATSVTVS